MSTTLLDIARAYYARGITPLPRCVGHVEPTYRDAQGEVQRVAWGQYKVKQPDWDLVAAWFAHSDVATTGMLLLTGSSAHPKAPFPSFLQILDVETAAVWQRFEAAGNAGECAKVLYRCVIERTPGGGAHIGFLCRAIGDTQKIPLARQQGTNKILIELLQHQPCTVAPTTIRCKPEHAQGATYTLTHGRWDDVLEISAEQRGTLLALAKSVNEVPEKTAQEQSRSGTGSRPQPGDVLNDRADVAWWEHLLMSHGWRDVSRAGLRSQGIWYFQRPGKWGNEPSATYGACGSLFYVFSSNAQPFEPDTGYSPFTAYTLLEHDGNYKAAAKQLAHDFGMAFPSTTSRRPARPEDNPDFVDPWLGKRSEWHGVPTAVRREA